MARALVLSESEVKYDSRKQSALAHLYSCITDRLPLFARLKPELREGRGTTPIPFQVNRKAPVAPRCGSCPRASTQLQVQQRVVSLPPGARNSSSIRDPQSPPPCRSSQWPLLRKALLHFPKGSVLN